MGDAFESFCLSLESFCRRLYMLDVVPEVQQTPEGLKADAEKHLESLRASGMSNDACMKDDTYQAKLRLYQEAMMAQGNGSKAKVSKKKRQQQKQAVVMAFNSHGCS